MTHWSSGSAWLLADVVGIFLSLTGCWFVRDLWHCDSEIWARWSWMACLIASPSGDFGLRCNLWPLLSIQRRRRSLWVDKSAWSSSSYWGTVTLSPIAVKAWMAWAISAWWSETGPRASRSCRNAILLARRSLWADIMQVLSDYTVQNHSMEAQIARFQDNLHYERTMQRSRRVPKVCTFKHARSSVNDVCCALCAREMVSRQRASQSKQHIHAHLLAGSHAQAQSIISSSALFVGERTKCQVTCALDSCL